MTEGALIQATISPLEEEGLHLLVARVSFSDQHFNVEAECSLQEGEMDDDTLAYTAVVDILLTRFSLYQLYRMTGSTVVLDWMKCPDREVMKATAIKLLGREEEDAARDN